MPALGEFAPPHADDYGATFGQAVLHRGDDLIGKRDLRIDRCQMGIGQGQTMNLGYLRWVSDPGFECIELMRDDLVLGEDEKRQDGWEDATTTTMAKNTYVANGGNVRISLSGRVRVFEKPLTGQRAWGASEREDGQESGGK